MRLLRGFLTALTAAGLSMAPDVFGQATAPVVTPAPVGVTPVRLADTPIVTILRLSEENPYGINVEAPALLPPKPPFNEFAAVVALFATMHVDRTGKVTQSKRPRDPIPSLAADTKKSFDRWTFQPARRAEQPVEAWASVRVDLSVGIRPPKIEQITLTPVTPSTPIPVPFQWGSDAAWYENLKAPAPSDGSVPIEQLDIPPAPKKTPWYADSFKGPFSCRLWVKVSAAGKIDKVLPIQVSDPILILYLRHELPNWPLHPARVKGQPADSWNELTMSGTVGYSVEVKQIINLRRTIG